MSGAVSVFDGAPFVEGQLAFASTSGCSIEQLCDNRPRPGKATASPNELSLFMQTQADRDIARNIAVHDRIARKYEARHGEIFNDVEQNRLRSALKAAKDAIRTDTRPLQAFDFGCGSGNLSSHLLALGFEVTAADVSPGFLSLVTSRYPQVTSVLMNGRDLSNTP